MERTWCDSSGFGSTGETTGFFLGGLVEVKSDFDWSTGGLEPLFFTVDVWDYVVVFYHFEILGFLIRFGCVMKEWKGRIEVGSGERRV